MSFHEKLLKYRKLRGFTQEEFAEKMEVSRQSISKWENGEAIPDLTKVMKMADVLDVGLDELCGREMAHKIEANQNIKAEQDIKLELKAGSFFNFVIPIVITIIIAVFFGIGGYCLGSKVTKDSGVYELPSNMAITGVNFDLNQYVLSCSFVPENYSEELEYTIIVKNLSTGEQEYFTPIFENGIGCVEMRPGNGDFQIILQISNGKEEKNIIIEDRIFLDVHKGTYGFPELVP